MSRMERIIPRKSDAKYTVKYWSTRKKGATFEAYGQTHLKIIQDAEQIRERLRKSKDIYRIEIWQLVSAEEREKVVEDFHGNPAHLSLTNSRREFDNG